MYITLHRHDRKAALDPLSKKEIVALLDVCAHHSSEPPRWAKAEAARILRDLHTQEQWIACDCRHDLEEPAVMAPVLRQGAYHLRRGTSVLHASTCPFYTAFIEPAETKEHAEPASELVSTPWTGDWNLLPMNGVVSEEPSPTLEKLLLSVVNEVGIGGLDSAELVAGPGRLRYVDALRDYTLLQSILNKRVFPRIPWRYIGTFRPDVIPTILAKMRIHESRFPQNVRPQCFTFLIVDSIVKNDDGSSLLVCRVKGEEVLVKVEGKVTMPDGSQGTPGPFLVLAVGAARKPQGFYTLVEAFAHPVHSRSILSLVRSEMERNTLSILMDQMRYWMKPTSPVARITYLNTPLFDFVSETGPCRPTFVITLPNQKNIAVECMGAVGDTAVLDAKRRNVARLRTLPDIADVVEYWPERDDEQAWRKTLTGVIRRHINGS